MNSRLKMMAVLLGLFAGAAGMAPAADITFRTLGTVAHGRTSYRQVIHSGRVVQAAYAGYEAFGAQTVHGVAFNSGLTHLADSGTYDPGSAASPKTGNPAYDGILQVCADDGAGVLTLTGLTVGHKYEVELFGLDDRADEAGRIYQYNDGNGHVSVSFPAGSNTIITGAFTADATTQIINETGPAGHNLNAFVLEDETSGAPKSGGQAALVLPNGINAAAPRSGEQAPPVLRRGMNLGDMLEAPHEGDWGPVLRAEYFTIVKQAGFDHVRLPIRWSNYCGPGPAYTIDPAWLAHIDWAVAQARANGLPVILDDHYDDELTKDPDRYGDRFVAIWKQLAEHYRHEPDSVLFELLNEPQFDNAHWNPLVARAVAAIRRSNPKRTIVIGAGGWYDENNLPGLKLPANDPHILVTFHYYSPMQLTFQGASWTPGSAAWVGATWAGTDAQRATIRADLKRAQDWATARHLPIYLGEFGVIRNAAMDSRTRWDDAVARTAESLGIPWAYWEFCADDFGAYDRNARQWREPILRALIPAGSK